MRKEDLPIREVIERETGQQFNRAGKMCCPLHSEKTPSFTIYPETNSWYCFGCGTGGDAIAFIEKYRNLNYVDSCKHLEIELDPHRQAQETEKERVINFALKYHTTKQLKDIYTFTDEQGTTLYYKLKLATPDGGKITPYYTVDSSGSIQPKRIPPEVPYHLHKAIAALKKQKPIFFTEGEKDCHTLENWGYTATSIKGVKADTFDFSVFKDAKVYFCGDTGQAGEHYKGFCWDCLKDHVQAFCVLELPGLAEMGDNRDASDWAAAGHTRQEFQNAIKDSWDWKKSRLWIDVKEVTKDGEKVFVPSRSWKNLDLLLSRRGIQLKYNMVRKDITVSGTLGAETGTNEDLATDIQRFAERDGLKLSFDETTRFMNRIASNNAYNPFVDYLKAHENENSQIIDDVFNCLEINPDFEINREIYRVMFTKWLLNVVRQAHNSKENRFESQGVLVLQGKQGTFKSTFFKNLLLNPDWFKGGSHLDPSDRDSVLKNTKFVLVELGELDSTLRGDLARIKAFLSENTDVIRKPYGKSDEEYPRFTTFCATVNRTDFLKDPTGNRRFWVIPVEKCNINKLNQIDKGRFWGAVYALYRSEKVPYWLNEDENQKVCKLNMSFDFKTDAAISLDELLDWDASPLLWDVFSVTDLCHMLQITKKTDLKQALEQRGYKYAAHRDNRGRIKKGYKLPPIKSVETDDRINDKTDYLTKSL